MDTLSAPPRIPCLAPKPHLLHVAMGHHHGTLTLLWAKLCKSYSAHWPTSWYPPSTPQIHWWWQLWTLSTHLWVHHCPRGVRSRVLNSGVGTLAVRIGTADVQRPTRLRDHTDTDLPLMGCSVAKVWVAKFEWWAFPHWVNAWLTYVSSQREILRYLAEEQEDSMDGDSEGDCLFSTNTLLSVYQQAI